MSDTAIRVLLVDNDPDEHVLIRDLLQESNNQTYAVDWEPLYDVGLKTIAHDQHDVYLIDYRLGEKNGLDLIREAIANGCAKPLIMLTGSADEGIDDAVMKAGAADYLDKSQIGQIHSVMRYDEPKAHGEVVRGQVGDPLLESAIRHVLIREDTQQALNRANALSKSLISSSLDMIIAVDNNRRITEFNPAAERIFGYSREEALGQPVNIIYGSSSKARDVSNHVSKTGTFTGEVLNKRKNGETFTSYLSSSVLRDHAGMVLGVMGISRDITEQKRTEKALRKATLAAEEANRAKSRFLNAMSHELRTPLNSILGFTELLGGQFFGALNDKQSEYIALLEASSRHLLDLVNDVLDLAKLDVGASELHRKNFAPRQLVEESVALMSALFAKKKLEVTVSADAAVDLVYGDTRRCKQILLNLLSNAVKYSPEGGHIDVHVARQDDATIRLSVSDHGVGIPPTNLNRIFDEFYQVDEGRDSQLGGTGIGLALVKRLVELHGGEVGVESEAGVGATFWFTLPLPQDTGPIHKPSSPDLKAHPTERRILVVDDNHVNLTLFSEILTRFGHTVTIANNGREAIDLARSSRPDAVLMDVIMPEMDGLEATRQLRAIPEFKSLPIIAITGNADPESLQHCGEAGFTMHLEKPVGMKELLEALRECLTEKEALSHE